MSHEAQNGLLIAVTYAALALMIGGGGFNVFRAEWLSKRRLRYASRKFGENSRAYRATRSLTTGQTNLLATRLVHGLVALFALAVLTLALSQNLARP